MFDSVTILGAGSWGMAVANLLIENEQQVTLWEHKPEAARLLKETRVNQQKLKDFMLDEKIEITSDLKEAVDASSLIVLAVPSQKIRELIKKEKSALAKKDLVCLSKGIENNTLMRMSEVIEEELGGSNCKVCILSGPSHAEEVVRKIPTTIVASGKNKELTEKTQAIFSNNYFRVYISDDIIGVELGGALKNIIAIACGITDGLGMGDNTRGALITRGLAEITRLGAELGADSKTFAGLSGLGDMVTTCSSEHSRNRRVGFLLGKGKSLNDILSGMNMVAEGVATTKSGYELSQKYNIEMPITAEVYNVLFENKNPKKAVEDLMVRKLKSEIWH